MIFAIHFHANDGTRVYKWEAFNATEAAKLFGLRVYGEQSTSRTQGVIGNGQRFLLKHFRREDGTIRQAETKLDVYPWDDLPPARNMELTRKQGKVKGTGLRGKRGIQRHHVPGTHTIIRNN